MKQVIFLLIISISVTFVSCTENKKEIIEQKTKELKGLKKQVAKLEKELTKLYKGIEKKEKVVTKNITANTLKYRSFETKVNFGGVFKSRQSVVTGAETSGKIIKIYVKEGDFVIKGQTIAKLDSKPLEKQKENIEIQLSLAKTVFERQKNLWDEKIGSEIDYLKAKNNFDALYKNLAQVKEQIKLSKVISPFAGRIEEILQFAGTIVSPTLPIVRIIGNKEFYAEFEIPEKYSGKIPQNQIVEVLSSANSTKSKGKVINSSKYINPNNRSFRVEVKLENSKNFYVNQTVESEITVYKTKKALVIDGNYMGYDSKGNYVYVVDKNNFPKKRHIKVGNSYKNEVEVISGLSENETVIEKGFDDLSEEIKVKILSNGN